MMAPFLISSDKIPLSLSAKFHTQLMDHLTGAINISGLALIGDNGNSGDSIAYFSSSFGTITYGTRNKNLTLGVGLTSTGTPIVGVSGQVPIESKFYFIAENYVSKNGLVLAYGCKYLTNKFDIDICISLFTGTDIFNTPSLGTTGSGGISVISSSSYTRRSRFICITLPFGNKSKYSK